MKKLWRRIVAAIAASMLVACSGSAQTPARLGYAVVGNSLWVEVFYAQTPSGSWRQCVATHHGLTCDWERPHRELP